LEEKGMSKRVVNLIIYLAVIGTITLVGASYILKQGDTNNGFNINKRQIQTVKIAAYPEKFQAINITDTQQISTIIDYFATIEFSKTKLNHEEYLGGGYLIEIQFKDNKQRVFYHKGNMFFIEKDKFTYRMKYDDAIKFDTIVANIVESNQAKTGESAILGTIISIKSEPSGRNISCVIKDKENKTHNISLQNASIIDSTGNGWMILHEGDEVKIFYKKDKLLEDGSLSASTVYIKKAAN